MYVGAIGYIGMSYGSSREDSEYQKLQVPQMQTQETNELQTKKEYDNAEIIDKKIVIGNNS